MSSKQIIEVSPEATIEELREKYKRQIIEATPETITALEYWIFKDEEGRPKYVRPYIVTRNKRGHHITHEIPELYRIAITLTYMVHGHYYNFTLYYFHHDKDYIDSITEDLRELARKELEKQVRYPQALWWFELEEGKTETISDIEPVKFDVDKIDTWEIEVGEIPKKEWERRIGLRK